jgi:hypothetical protein
MENDLDTKLILKKNPKKVKKFTKKKITSKTIQKSEVKGPQDPQDTDAISVEEKLSNKENGS